MHHGQDHHVKIISYSLLRLQGLAAFTAFGYFLFSAGRKFWTLREVCSAYESFGLGKPFYSVGTCQDAPKPMELSNLRGICSSHQGGNESTISKMTSLSKCGCLEGGGGYWSYLDIQPYLLRYHLLVICAHSLPTYCNISFPNAAFCLHDLPWLAQTQRAQCNSVLMIRFWVGVFQEGVLPLFLRWIKVANSGYNEIQVDYFTCILRDLQVAQQHCWHLLNCRTFILIGVHMMSCLLSEKECKKLCGLSAL